MNQITHPISFPNLSPRSASPPANGNPARSRGKAWLRAVLLLAAGWNIIGGVTALLDPAKHFATMYTATLALDEPLQLFFYRCTWINVIAWGVGYVIAAFFPVTRAAVLVAGGAGKLTYFAASVALFASGVGNGMVLTAGLVDVAFAVLFAITLLAERRARQEQGGPQPADSVEFRTFSPHTSSKRRAARPTSAIGQTSTRSRS